MNDDAGNAGNVPARILAGILALLAVVILVGTVYAFASGSQERGKAKELAGPLEAGEAFFDRIGRIRAKAADGGNKIIVASISCLYDARDIQFKDELFSKTPDLKKICVEFFSGKSESDLSPALEGRLKAELRDRLNSILVLGKLKAIYFADFSLID